MCAFRTCPDLGISRMKTSDWVATVGVVIISFFILAAEASADELGDIVQRISDASEAGAVRSAMAELVEIGTAPAAAIFAEELERIADTTEFSLVPFIALSLRLDTTDAIQQSVIPALESVMDMGADDGERLYISAALGRFGNQEMISWLVEEHRSSKPDYMKLAYSLTTFELICATNQEAAVRYVVSQATQSTDPTLKLGAERCLRETGNSAALEVMRRWETIKTGDLDLSVAEQYLLSIGEFGDDKDLEFLGWLVESAPQLFHPDDVASQITPLVEMAYANIDSRSSTPPSAPITILAILAALLFVILSFVILLRRKTS